MTNDGYELRTAKPDDWDTMIKVLDLAFSEPLDDEQNEVERSVFEPERTLLATRDGEVTGVAAAFTRRLTVPGGEVPAAHVTLVGVHPVHRRRGLLTQMMRQQLADVRELGEPVAVLWASEGRIYQRFGYGMAAGRISYEADHEVQLWEQPGTVSLRSIELAAAEPVLRPVYERVVSQRPGWSDRDERWWGYVLSDVPANRNGGTPRRVVVHEGGSGVDGYALWRVKGDWPQAGPRGTVQVREVVAENPEAYRELWHFLLNIDLTRVTSFWSAATDEPLPWLVNEPRRLRGTYLDSLWVRLVDVPAALAARRYAAPVDVVIEVSDPILAGNTGSWHLVGDPSGAACTPAGRPADLHCTMNALGAAYLGGATLAALAGAGQVRELSPGALATATTAFGWHRAPSATETF